VRDTLVRRSGRRPAQALPHGRVVVPAPPSVAHWAAVYAQPGPGAALADARGPLRVGDGRSPLCGRHEYLPGTSFSAAMLSAWSGTIRFESARRLYACSVCREKLTRTSRGNHPTPGVNLPISTAVRRARLPAMQGR
jgi:hypothetical protein